ncbi:MAG: outer membrane protein assembly factor BamB family protein [Caldimonas sp.]
MRAVALVFLALALHACGGGGAVVATSTASDKAVAFHIDAAHTGVSGISAPTFPATPSWSRTFTDRVSYPLIADGKVFVVEEGGQGTTHPSRLHALDRTTGAVAWGPVDLPGTFPAAGHAFDRGKVFVATYEGLIMSFDAATGQPGWSTKLPNSYAFVSAPTAVDGVVHVVDSATNSVVALDESNGSLLWTVRINGGNSPPAIAANKVFVASPCNYYALDTRSGMESWHYNGPCSGGGGATVVVAQGVAYVREFFIKGYIEARDAISGALLSKFTPASAFSQLPIPAVTATSVFVLDSGTLQRLDRSLGTISWSFAGDGTLTSAPIVIGSFVIVGSSSGSLYAVDAATGVERWSARLPTGLDPTIESYNVTLVDLAAGEGYLVVPARNTLTAFRLSP